jgi:fumarylacetoacetase
MSAMGEGARRTWVPGADGSPWGLANLPFGVVRAPGGPPRPAVRVGEHALILDDLARAGRLPVAPDTFAAPVLNPFLALGEPTWRAVRAALGELLRAPRAPGREVSAALVSLADVEPALPVTVGDYVDFYASREHAANLGRLLRPGQPPLLANWRHLPVGYHGRAGTLAVSGAPVRRPSGQLPPARAGDPPGFAPEPRLDFELELGFVTGAGPAGGGPVTVATAARYVFGAVLVNDWSARSIQRWEYQPLGPFLGKSFQTSIGAWVVPLAALDSRRVRGPAQAPAPPPYLRAPEPRGLDIDLEVALMPAGGDAEVVLSRSNARGLYWGVAQLVAHTTVNGATLRAGDLLASGTISGPVRGTEGSLIELTRGGAEPLTLPGGVIRTFLQDGDTVILRGSAGPGVSLGEVRGTVLGSA